MGSSSEAHRGGKQIAQSPIIPSPLLTKRVGNEMESWCALAPTWASFSLSGKLLVWRKCICLREIRQDSPSELGSLPGARVDEGRPIGL